MFKQFTKTQKALSVATATVAATSFAYYMNEKQYRKNIYHSTVQLQEAKASSLPSLLVRNKAFAEALDQKQGGHDFWHSPSREEMIKRLKQKEEYDLLIVGGGATGAGVAVDAATRGLKVALVERDDFASGNIILSSLRAYLQLFIGRYFFKINKTCSWWCPLSSKGYHGIRL